MFRERYTDYKKSTLHENDFYRGITSSQITINKKEYTLASGILGCEFYNEVIDPKYPDDFLQYVKPAVGWALYAEDPDKPKVPERVFIAADTAGDIFK